MKKNSLALLADQAMPDGPIIDIGCGEGHLVEDLAAAFPARFISGLDLNIQALSMALTSNGATPFTQANFVDLPLSSSSCAAIVALNVLDQSQVEPEIAVAESWRVLRSGGILLVCVGAYEWLYGPHDQVFGSGRRYTTNALRQLLLSAAFTIERMTYANSLLLFPAIATRLAQRNGLMSVQQGLAATKNVSKILSATLSAEAPWLRRHRFPAGLSLYALARKP